MPRVCRYARLVEAVVQTWRSVWPSGRSSWSTFPPRACTRQRCAPTCSRSFREAFAPEYAAEDAFVFARPAATRRAARPARRPLRHRARAGQRAGPHRRRRGARLWRDRHEGRRRGRARGRPRSRARRARPVRRGAAPLRQGGAAGAVQPAARPVRALAARPGRRSRDPARAHRSDDPGGLPREHERARHLLRRQRPLGTPLDGRERDRQGDRGPGPDRSSRAARGDRGWAAVLRGRLDHRSSRRASPRT